jgi:hypothetical protein
LLLVLELLPGGIPEVDDTVARREKIRSPITEAPHTSSVLSNHRRTSRGAF